VFWRNFYVEMAIDVIKKAGQEAWRKIWPEAKNVLSCDVNNARSAVCIANITGFEEADEENREATTEMWEELMTAAEE
jgi:hypothetical protein